jgi:hypothetical protein
VRPDDQVDPVANLRVAGGADADDAAVLDPDVRLDDTQGGVDHHRSDDDGVELAFTGVVGLGLAQADGLAVAPRRLVAACLAIVLDAQPQVGVGDADPISPSRAAEHHRIVRGRVARVRTGQDCAGRYCAGIPS